MRVFPTGPLPASTASRTHSSVCLDLLLSPHLLAGEVSLLSSFQKDSSAGPGSLGLVCAATHVAMGSLPFLSLSLSSVSSSTLGRKGPADSRLVFWVFIEPQLSLSNQSRAEGKLHSFPLQGAVCFFSM